MKTHSLNGKVKFDLKKQLEREETLRKINERAQNKINLKTALRKAGFITCLVFGLLAGQGSTIYAETASWYSEASCKREGTSGVWTASGERFKDDGMTCAIRSRNFGGIYRVCNVSNGKCVTVKHNDFGPNKRLWNEGRKIDLSKGAFASIASLKQGIINVTIERVK